MREMTTKDSAPETRLDAATRLAGYGTDLARAELLDVSDRTLRRARKGVLGEDFMAKAVAALRPHSRKLAKEGIEVSLDSFFEVV